MRLSLISLAALSTALLAAPAIAQEHGHDHDDHGHQHDDHGHAHDDQDHGAHAHEDEHHPSGLRLDVEPAGDLAPGRSATLSLQLSGPDGAPVTAADFVDSHERLVHVLIVDEGLEDFHHLHVEPDAEGRTTLSFTPAHARIYRVWVDGRLAEPFDMTAAQSDHHDDAGHHDDHGHGHDDHGGDHHADHGDEDHGHEAGHGDHEAHGEGAVRATDWVRVGDEAAPFIIPADVLTADAGGLAFTLSPQSDVRAGGTVSMALSVAGADGSLEPHLGAYAHIVGFGPAATSMAHAHPLGDTPLSADERAGPDLAFEVGFEERGVHRLFVEIRHDGELVTAPFTLVVAE